MYRRYFFHLMLLLVVFNAVLAVAKDSYWALWGWGVVLVCLAGWRTERQQLDQTTEALDDITAQLRDINQEFDRG